MAVQIENTGDHSAVITYGLTDTKADIYPILASTLQQFGWTLHDDAQENQYVFRAPMIDNPEIFKYAQLDWATKADKLYINIYEDWDAEKHTGKNQAAFYSADLQMQLLSEGVWGTVWLFASPRYIALFCTTRSDTGNETIGTGSNGDYSWTATIEITKDNPSEVTGEYPRFALLSAGSANGKLQAGSASTNSYARGYALPRSIANTTVEADVCCPNVVGTLYGRPCMAGNSTVRLDDVMPSNANPFDLDTAFCSTLWALTRKVNTATTVMDHVRGRFFGVKVLAKFTGTDGDIIKIPCDADYFYLPEEDGGVLKDHLIIGSGSASGINRTLRWAIPL